MVHKPHPVCCESLSGPREGSHKVRNLPVDREGSLAQLNGERKRVEVAKMLCAPVFTSHLSGELKVASLNHKMVERVSACESFFILYCLSQFTCCMLMTFS